MLQLPILVEVTGLLLCPGFSVMSKVTCLDR